ncbi:hypothetical protein NMY22_g11799 [Coprinellus aureogranulatus]|nr:hypothetical protein NMY22_g11799 [Coprinellus aureogranulatus]
MQRFSAPTRALLRDGIPIEPNDYAELIRQRAIELEEELQAIRARGNTLSLPNRLPAELLTRIFVMLAEEMAKGWDDTKHLEWIRICHVCVHWRSVALAHAPLWSRISFAPPELMKLLLSRSKGALLDIAISTRQLKLSENSNASSVRECLAEIMAQTTRMRSVDIEISSSASRDYHFKDLLSRASGCAPVLRELTLSDCKTRLEYGEIPSQFLQRGTPALRILKLEQINMPWERLPLSTTLTHLDLNLRSARPTVAQFYETVSMLDSLEDLELTKSGLPTSGYSAIPSPTSSQLTLRSLKKLRVEDFADRIRDFFNVVRLPSVYYTGVKFCDPVPQAALVDRCLQNVRTAVNDAMQGFPEMTELSIQGPGSEDLVDDPQFYMKFGGPLGGLKETCFCLTVLFSSDSMYRLPFAETLSSINKIFDYSTIATLGLSGSGPFLPNSILKTFSSLQKVKRLEFIDTPIHTTFYQRNQDPALKAKSKGAKSRRKPYFPALSSILFSAIDFKGNGMGSKDVFRTVVDALNKRPKAHRVQRLQLQYCQAFGDDELAMLSDLLPDVELEWDGHEEWMDQDTGEDSEDFSELGDTDDFDSD